MSAEGTQLHRVVDLRCESTLNPLGLGAARPRLSWRLESAQRGARQRGYQVVVTDDEAPAASAAQGAVPGAPRVIWDSGLVASAQTTQVAYGGPRLAAGQRCTWRVRSWNAQGEASAWSEPACWEMGLLAPTDWRADWISARFDAEDRGEESPPLYLRRAFTLDAPIRRARLYLTSQGLFEAHINGRRVGDALLTPGWTSYHARTLVCTFDVTELLHEGENAIGALVGDGWFRGRIGALGGSRNGYGTRLALLAQLQVTHADGSVTLIGSDESWRASTGPLRSASLYDGECYDAHFEAPGWDAPGFDATTWEPIERIEAPRHHLEATPGPWVRRMQELPPVSVQRVDDNVQIFDLGQNITGWVRLRVAGAPGMQLRLRHAEVLEADGSLHTANLRSAKQTDSYTLASDALVSLEPHFTFHGFRFVELRCEPAWPATLELTGIVIHSDLETTGAFSCSDERLNQLQRNIVWGQRGNFVDIPTDCPQRDERLGWGGDVQLFAPTACFNMDSSRFLAKWLRDFYADQRADGLFPIVAPMPRTVVQELTPPPGMTPPFRITPGYGAAGYADAGVIVPWTLYTIYGDRQLLEDCYPGMVRWAEHVLAWMGDGLIVENWFQFGDWLAPYASTIPDLAATAYFAYSLQLLRRIATLLGQAADAARFEALGSALRAAFCTRFVQADGRMEPASQSAYVLALAFDLLPDELRAPAAALLVEDIRARGNHLSTGFLGTPWLCRVLVDAGYLNVAYDLLLQESYPSWLYPITQGATTIWERWNGIEPDSSLFNPAMNSFNHYAYGAIGDFLYRTVAGLDRDPSVPGYQRLLIRPRPGGSLTSAAAALRTPHGPAEVAWQILDGRFLLDVTLPPNSTGTLLLPTRDGPEAAREGGAPLAQAEGIYAAGQTVDGLQVELGAGRYRFEATYRAPPSLPSPAPNLTFRYPRFSIYTSGGAILDDIAAMAVLARTVDDLETLRATMQRRRMYSLSQLQRFHPTLLTAPILATLERELGELE